MKVRSRHRSKQQRQIRVAVVALGVVGVGMLTPWLFSVTSAVVLYPVQVTRDWFQYSSDFIPTVFRGRKELHDQIAELQHQLRVAESSTLSFERLFEENQRLRGMLKAGETDRLAAAVIARPNELPYDLVQIDRGSKHKVEIGAPVFVGQDVVIGLVVHTAPEYSFVELVSTSGFEATAYVSGANIVATLEGLGGGVARVRVPQGVPLSIGDLVYLPSIEPGVYGRISYLENEPTQPEQFGYITPEVALAGLRWVSVGQLSQISKSPQQIEASILEEMKRALVVPGVVIGEMGSTSTTTTNIATGTPSAIEEDVLIE